jgi:hypothetical protein
MNTLLSRIGFAMLALLLPLAGHAQLFRTYVASFGNDANPCTVAAPCRLLPAAIAAALPGGEVWILDSANFNSGTVNVTKNISILAIPGEVGSIVSGGGAAAISLATNTKLKLRNVAILNNVNNPGTDGIVAAAGSRLTIEHSEIGVVGTGVDVTNATAYIGHTAVHGSTIGVAAHGGAKVDVAHDKFVNNSQYAVYSDGSLGGQNTRVFVSDSTFFNNNAALAAVATAGDAGARLTAVRCAITRGMYGTYGQLASAGNVVITVGYSMLAGLNIAFHNVGGVAMETEGNNLVRNNQTDTDSVLINVGSM